MTITPLISIIVPVYNVEPYLRKCADSILSQTYTNIEAIFIDDGSSDGCPAICDKYAAKDNRVVVIHQKNAGVCAARNAGLDIAKGEYISFVDGDDWIESDMYEVLCNVIRKSGADIVECSNCINDDIPTKVCNNDFVTFTSRETINLILNGRFDLFYVWRKLYTRNIIDNMRFCPSFVITEDGPFVIQAISKSHSISYINYQCYHYTIREDSISHTFCDDFWFTLNAADHIIDVIKNFDSTFGDAADRCAIKYALNITKEAEAKGDFTRYAHQKVAIHIRKYMNIRSWHLLSHYDKCWTCLILLGRTPFIIGRLLSKTLKKFSVK